MKHFIAQYIFEYLLIFGFNMKKHLLILFSLLSISVSELYGSITNPSDSLKDLLSDENTTYQYRLRNKLGDYYIADSPAIAYNYYSGSYAIAEQMKLDTLVALSLNKMGICKLKTEDYPLSKEFMIRALEIYELYRAEDKIAYLNYYLGLAEYYQGNYEQSVKNYQKALKSFTSSGNVKLEANVYQNLGLVHDDLNNDSLALEYYLKSLHINERLDQKADIAGLTQNIGLFHIHDNNLDLALEFINKSYRIYKELNDHEGIGISLSNLGLVYQKQGKYVKALEYYLKSLDEFAKDNFLIGKIYALHNIGTSYNDLNDHTRALDYYNRSIGLSESIGHIQGIMTNYEAISNLYGKTGDYKHSLEYYILYDNLKDSINSADARNRITEVEAIYKLGLMDNQLTRKSMELAQQRRQKKIFIAGSFVLLILLVFSALAYHQKIIAEKELNRHKENLEELVKQRTRELDIEMHERRIAEESDRLKSAFLANMSHELRTPMNAIIAFTNFLKDKSISLDKRDEYANYITTAGESLLHLIDDIIDIAKIESKELTIKKRDCNITTLCIELYNIFHELRKKKNKECIELILNPSCYKNSVSICTDPYRLKQILSNLLENALKYTREGNVEFGFEVSGLNILFYIRDTGIGIHSSKFDYIFERFSQISNSTEKQFGGTGLGLAITKNLVELMRGKIWLESELNKGTTFYLTIPADEISVNAFSETMPLPAKTTVSFFEYDWDGKTILVAEDEELNFKVLESALCRTKVRVVRAINGYEAIDLVKSNNIDLVLMDIQMPGMDGYQATKEIKKINSKLPVIAQTSFAMEGEKDKCIMAGCDDYLAKPLNLNILFGTIGRYFN
ncbi:MAG: tetratricopeptide repeat protein [Bacteroidales bacterium]